MHFTRLAILLAAASLAVSCGSGQKAGVGRVDHDVVIIGGGMGGLTAGATLAQAGLDVLLLERRYQVGGCTSSFSRGEFNFDAGLHQLSMGGGDGAVRQILEETGVLGKIELIQLPELARSIFPGVDFTTPTSQTAAISDLKRRWPKEAGDIDAFYRLAAEVSKEMAELSEMYRSDAVTAGLSKLLIPLRQPNLFAWRDSTLSDVLDKYFEDNDLKAVISQYWLYFGPPPSKVWAPMFLAAYYSYVSNGAWQIRGSSQALSDAFAARIRESGGTVRTGTSVVGIDIENGRVSGVVTADGTRTTARYVISNADPFQTFKRLIRKEDAPPDLLTRIDDLRPSNSLAGVYLGLDVTPARWNINEYEIFYHTSNDTSAMYEAMIEGRFDEGAVSLTFYSNTGDTFYAPEGKSVLVLNAYAAADYWTEPGYEGKKSAREEQLITLAEHVLPGLRDHIVVREGMTPYTIEYFTRHEGGVPYGWDLVPKHYERIGNDTPIEGLFLAGAWAGMIHGGSGAILSGSRAARLIMDIEGIK